MKPREAADSLRLIAQAVSANNAIPLQIRGWFGRAVMCRLADPSASLDRLLGLRSRHAGRLSLHSKIPERDAALRALARSLGGRNAKECANEILRMKRAGLLPEIDAVHRIPGHRQLLRIISDAI